MVPPLAVLPFIGGIGVPEALIFGVIVLVLFGKRLPGAMRSLGQSVGELKKGLHESGEDDDVPAAAPAAVTAAPAEPAKVAE